MTAEIQFYMECNSGRLDAAKNAVTYVAYFFNVPVVHPQEGTVAFHLCVTVRVTLTSELLSWRFLYVKTNR